MILQLTNRNYTYRSVVIFWCHLGKHSDDWGSLLSLTHIKIQELEIS